MSCWREFKLKNFVNVNPKENLIKGTIAKRIQMDNLLPFCRDVKRYEIAKYLGGSKFRNEDTVMARITPCLENGKRAKVSILEEGEIGFGSTEYIVFREKKGISDANFIYYLVCSDLIREPAIKSMVGSSGRQRVQLSVIENLQLTLPPLSTQQKIAKVLSAIDDKIELNNKINENLEQQAQAMFYQIYKQGKKGKLEEIISRIETGLRPKGGAQKHGIPSIGAENIESFGKYDYSKDKYISEVFFKQLNRGIVISGDVLLYKDGAYVGKVSMALDGFPHEKCAVNEHVFVIRTNKLATQFSCIFVLQIR